MMHDDVYMRMPVCPKNPKTCAVLVVMELQIELLKCRRYPSVRATSLDPRIRRKGCSGTWEGVIKGLQQSTVKVGILACPRNSNKIQTEDGWMNAHAYSITRNQVVTEP